MIPNHKLIKIIQNHSGDQDSCAYIATMERDHKGRAGTYQDHGYRNGEGPPLSMQQDHSADLLFAPLVFTGKRSNDNVDRPGVLFADLDGASKPTIEPTIYWETSPGNTQAVWLLDGQFDDYEEWADLNRRMTLYTGADVGGWMGSKVLRVPESVNWKRRAFGRLLWYHSFVVHKIRNLQKALPPLETPAPRPPKGEHPAVPSMAESDLAINFHWAELGLRARSMLLEKKVKDRSLWIIKTAHELFRSGLDEEQVFVVLWGRPWNKWRTTRYNPALLWAEIVRAAPTP